MILIPILLFLIPLAIKLGVDIKKWREDKPVGHADEIAFLIAGMIPAGIGFVFFSQIGSFVTTIIVGLMMFFWYWTLFDGLYNIIRRYINKKLGKLYKHLTWWYTGTNDKDDAKTDNFLQSIELWEHIAIKIGGIIATTIAYIFSL